MNEDQVQTHIVLNQLYSKSQFSLNSIAHQTTKREPPGGEHALLLLQY